MKKNKNNNQLKQYFVRNFIHMQKFAEHCGISKQHLYDIVNNRYLPNLQAAFAIEDGTHGEITARSWLNKDAQESDEENKEKRKNNVANKPKVRVPLVTCYELPEDVSHDDNPYHTP